MRDDFPAKTDRPLLLFSGGLDSTYILEQYFKADIKLELLYVTGVIHPDKEKMEIRARQKIISYLVKKYDRNVVVDDHERSATHYQGTQVKYGQISPWLFSALQTVEPSHTELLVGYVQGDSIMPDLHIVKEIWEKLCGLVNHHSIPLNTPLVHTTKYDIMSYFRWAAPELLKLVWTCETPLPGKRLPVACKTCTPCRTLEREKYFFNKRQKKSDFLTKVKETE